MSIDIKDRQLIDRFLRGEVSGIEMEDFNRRLNTDVNFRQEKEMQELVYSGIQRAHEDKLKGIILGSINYRKPKIPVPLKIIFTFLAVTILGISLWFYIGNESPKEEQARSWFAFLKNKEAGQEVISAPPKQKIETRQKPNVTVDSLSKSSPTVMADGDSVLSGLETEERVPDTIGPAEHLEDIVVKQDEILISAILDVEERNDSGSVPGSSTLTKDAVQHLNPAADLPEEEQISPSYLVEFWVSPINYRGYKMSKNKLILFGIEEPDAVKLYRTNGALYMNYHKEFYRLDDSFEFVSYHKLKDFEIPLAIR